MNKLPYNLNFENAPQVLRSVVSRCLSKEATRSLEVYDNDPNLHSGHNWEEVKKSLFSVSGVFARVGAGLSYKVSFDSAVAMVRDDEFRSIQEAYSAEEIERWDSKDFQNMGSPDLFLLSMVLDSFRSQLDTDSRDKEQYALYNNCKVICEYFGNSQSFSGLSSVRIGYKSSRDKMYYNAFAHDDYFAHMGNPEIGPSDKPGTTTAAPIMRSSDVDLSSVMPELIKVVGVGIVRYLNSHGYINDVPGAMKCLEKISK